MVHVGEREVQRGNAGWGWKWFGKSGWEAAIFIVWSRGGVEGSQVFILSWTSLGTRILNSLCFQNLFFFFFFWLPQWKWLNQKFKIGLFKYDLGVLKYDSLLKFLNWWFHTWEMQSLLLSRILGHTFWNTNYEVSQVLQGTVDWPTFILCGQRGKCWRKKPGTGFRSKNPTFWANLDENLHFKASLEMKFSMGIMSPKGHLLSLIQSSIDFSFRGRAGIIMSIINVRKLSKSFNDFPRFTRLVRGGTRLSGAWRGPSSVLGAVSWQGVGSRVSGMDVLSGRQHR